MLGYQKLCFLCMYLLESCLLQRRPVLDREREGSWQLLVPNRESAATSSKKNKKCLFVLYIYADSAPQQRQQPEKQAPSKSSALHPTKNTTYVGSPPRIRWQPQTRRSQEVLSRTGCPGPVSTCHVMSCLARPQRRTWALTATFRSSSLALPRHFFAKSWLHTTQLEPTPHPAPNPMNALLMPGEPENRARGRDAEKETGDAA